MATWKILAQGLIVVALLFFAIPVRVPSPEEARSSLEIQSIQFDLYIKNFNKTYAKGTPEYEKRFAAFKNSLSFINLYNERRTHNDTAIYGLTKFSDLSAEEFEAKNLIKPKKRRFKMSKFHMSDNEIEDSKSIEDIRPRRQIAANNLPQKIDWRDKGIISEVINQGLCGACWAYSTIHTIEALYAKNHNLTKLSVQQIIDCATNGNYGCLGGDICNLLDWLVTYNVLIRLENEYPITHTSGSCKIQKADDSVGIRIEKYTCSNLVGVENNLLRWLAYKGPVAVAINALSWQNYLGGVIQYHCNGSPKSLNHAVQIVGYDLTADIPYYIAKNSWGTTFGNKGYVNLAIGENICGLANEVSMITV